MIPIFIPSKDRACQLHLLLESFQKNIPAMFDPHVLCTWSNDQFLAGYDRIVNEFPEVKFSIEENAEGQFYEFLGNYAEKDCVIGLFTDDSVLYRHLPITENHIENIFNNIPDLWCLSLRLGLNITVVDYVNNTSCPQPKNTDVIHCLDINQNKILELIKWDYTQFSDKFASYFGFPTSFDGCFYRAKDLLNLANNGHFEKMILWENMICNNGRQQLMNKNFMVAPQLSHVVTQQYNSSHNYGHRTNNAFNVSLEEMNKQYLSGQVIDLESMDFSEVNCSHGEISFRFKEKN